jgi:hypothetical protein
MVEKNILILKFCDWYSMHYIISQDLAMHWNGNWNKLLKIYLRKSQCFVTIWLLMIILPLHGQNTMALRQTVLNPLRMDVFCLYHSHGMMIKYGVFPKHSRIVCMHYLHNLAKLLGFSGAWPELCITFSVNTGCSPSITWIA